MKFQAAAKVILGAMLCFTANAFGEGTDLAPICADDTHSYNFAISQNDIPFVVWNVGIEQRIHLKYWDGKKWLALGDSAGSEGLVSTEGYANYPAIAAKDLEHVYLTWMDENEVYLKFWNGKTWGDSIGKKKQERISNTKGQSMQPDIAIDSNDKPYVIWNEEVEKGKYAVYLRYWDGNRWNELNQSATDYGIDQCLDFLVYPKIAISKSDQIYAAWIGAAKPPQPSDGDGIFVRYWSKNRWNNMAGSFTGKGINPITGMAHNSTLALDKSGNPVAAWVERPITATDLQESRIFLVRWDGSSWKELGGSASGQGLSFAGNTTNISIAFTSENNPIVAWGDTVIGPMIYLYQWDGSEWVDYSPKMRGYWYPMVRNDSKGNIYYSWLDESKDIYFIRMKVYSGAIK